MSCKKITMKHYSCEQKTAIGDKVAGLTDKSVICY